ncbi:MAG TPA: hypothetical protein VNL16_03985 [Chloroflexota bacterium]|nr:hypothetical protein [Chloroflexota bacterium]
MSTRVRSSIRRFFILFVGLILLTPSLAFAANDSAQSPMALSAATNSASDILVGSTGGAYRYYQFRYQGGNAPVLVSLSFQPAFEGSTNQAFGFNLYGPSGLSFQGTWTGNNGNTATIQYTLTNPAAMDVLTQVYNYTNGMQVNYTLTVSGLSGGSATGLVATTNTTPGQALNVTTINATLGGSIVGNAAGAFQFYNLRYPGGNAPLTITMNATPVYNAQGQAYGFNVYRANPLTGNTTLVASAVPTAGDVNSSTVTATVTEPSATVYQLQVFNYWPGVAVSYGINATGLAGAAPAVSGNGDAGHAVVLNSARQGATETLQGNSGGAFNYFLVNYPGSESQLSISITYSSLDGAPDHAEGFAVYSGSSLQATVNPSDDGTGVHSATWGYSNASAGTFGIQVFNYAPGTTVSYTIYQVGSQ